jgi:hypothetical protein
MSKPTAKQRRFFSKVVEVGCMACRQESTFSFPEIHHVKDYGRNDNSKVYGLCSIHHRPTAGVTGIPNRHGNPKEFAEKYGTDQELFSECMNLI